jgi:hypothetical protein
MTDAVDVALDVCDELANAHANGIVHGDLGLHRVRMRWPRQSGERVDIFALGENDSGAFAFRASAVGTLVSPEQRDGYTVDARADVWAVGAMLHWMIAGVPPTTEPIERTLSRAPRTLVITIASCLADDPSGRPQSVDALAELLGSFASSPPERFEQLALRRKVLENANRVRTDLRDIDHVLGRLDDAALARELSAAGRPSSPEPAPDQLAFAMNRSTASAIFDEPIRMTEVAETPAQRAIEVEQKLEAATAQAPREHGADASASREHGADASASREHGAVAAAPSEDGPDASASREHAPDVRASLEHGPDASAPREHGPDAPAPREHGPGAAAPSEHGPGGPAPREHGPDAPAPREQGPDVPAPIVHAVLPLATSPVVLSSALLAPPKPEVAPSSPVSSRALEPAPTSRRTKPWMTALAIVGAIASVSLGVRIGIGLVKGMPTRAAPAPKSSSVVTAAPAPVPASSATASSATATQTAEGSAVTPASLPDARLATPATLPDAKPLVARPRTSVAAPRPRASSNPTSAGDESVPKGFKSFDSTSDPSDTE